MIGAFDLAAALPTGTTVLEASAGTGKTYAIAGLVTRFVAEDRARIGDLLVVTFGRAATAELRDRVRSRMVATRDALLDPTAARTRAETTADPVLRVLAHGTDQDVALRQRRLATALADFDGATVATIHQFCQQVLSSLGTAADVDPQARLVEDVSDLVEEVCDDLYVRFALRRKPSFTRTQALTIAREALARADARIVPRDAVPDSAADLRVRFAEAVRREVAARKRARRILSFDDLLSSLQAALRDPVVGPVACARLRARYSVVLVDEFQDTDAVQWDVLRAAFHGHRPLVLIGDPKQAVYAFRGADVMSYLEATRAADVTATLGTNHRSDPRVVRAAHLLLRGAALGDEGIVVRDVEAWHQTAALLDAEGREDPTPVRLRLLGRDGLPTTRSGTPSVAPVREAVARDVGAQVAAVLAEGLQVRAARDGAGRPLAAGDVAVLVRTGKQAELVQAELRARRIPCVLSRGPSVFSTDAAHDWLALLEAVEQPHRSQRVRRLALSSFVGLTAHDLATGGERPVDELAGALRHWGTVLAERGVAGMFALVTETKNLSQRLLGLQGGERLLTDLRHIAESLHAESTAAAGPAALGLSGLLSWLRARVEEAAGDVDVERSRRLDTDRAAVQVTTVHASKGLEYEVVCVPYGWDSTGGGGGGFGKPTERFPVAHDTDGRRALHVGGLGAPRYDEFCALADAEDAGEELRLLYVALTRAVSRMVVWWAPSQNTRRGPLHRLLSAADPAAVPAQPTLPTDAALLDRLTELFGADQGRAAGLAVERVEARPAPVLPALPPAARQEPAAATFRATLDTGWRRTSYSGLTRAVHEAHSAAPQPVGHADAGSEPESAGTVDEVDLGAPAAAGSPADRRTGWSESVSPLQDLPAGAAFGTMVHAVLEGFDPAVPDRPAHLAALAREQFAGSLADPLAAALLAPVATPLGPLTGGAAFADIAAADRLDELEFELPLGGGDAAGPADGRLLGAVADLLLTHLPAGDPVHRYAEQLRDPALGDQPLRGYLTGSIDSVLRHRSPEPRYLVVDYKTNRLGAPGEVLTAWHYRREALDEAMLAAHYPLQAMLYCVALHRFLRWRQPGYDPRVHLGGVLYLFLRGMCGPDLEVTEESGIPGVWSWRPPAGLVVDLSDLLAGGTP